MSAEDYIKMTVEELLKVLATKNVIGEPIEIEDKTLIPVTKIGLCFGAGNAKGKDNGGGAGGAGGGAGVNPVAIVVISKGVKGREGIEVLSMTKPSLMTKSIGEVASVIIEKLREKKDTKKKEE